MFVAGADVLDRVRIRVLEFGFGVGTNFAALVEAASKAQVEAVDYVAVEHAPVPPDLLPAFDLRSHALAVQATTDQTAEADGVRLTLHRGRFEDHRAQGSYDAVFFDPFGPEDEPDSWGVEATAAAAAGLAEDGRLVTYSSAGWIRRNLAAVGLFVATVPGPIEGKREFTIAAKDRARLGPVKVRNVPR